MIDACLSIDLGLCEFEPRKKGRCFTGGGSSGGGGSVPANTTSQNTTTYIQDVPTWEQQYLSNLLGQAQTVAQQPYQQFPGQQVAALTDPQNQAFSNVQNLVNNGSWAPTEAAATTSANAGANTANGISAAGSPFYQASTGYNPLAAAAPFMGAAANSATPQGIQSYLSPFTNNVVQGEVNTANQNWNNNIMPSVNDAFIGNGQFASGRNAQVLGQAANQFETNLEGQVANTLESGYNTAGGQAATQAGILGNLANTGASAAGAQAANLQGAGAGLGNLAATQASAQAGAASNLAGVGQTGLNTGIAANAALQDVGQQQQQQNQANINVAEQNFQAQTMWPETQTSFLSNIIRGLPAMGTSGTNASQSPATVNQVGSVSPLSTLAGSLLGLGGAAGVSGAAGAGGAGNKRGGLIKGYAEGGIVAPPTPDEIDAELAHSPLQQMASAEPDDSELPAEAENERIAVNPLQAAKPQVADNGSQERGLQLLAMARGFLTPAHSGAEALGNAFGGLEGSIYKEPTLEGAQQDVIGKKLGNYQQIYGLALQNARMGAMGGPQMPLPSIPGMPDFSNAGFSGPPPSQSETAVAQPNGSLKPVADNSATSGTIPNNQIFSYLTNPQLLATATPTQKQQLVIAAKQLGYPMPAALETEAFAGDIAGAKANAQQQAVLDKAGAIQAAKTNNMVIPGPNGPIRASSILNGGDNAPAPHAAPANPPSAESSTQTPAPDLMAIDGKPFVPELGQGMTQPDASSRPTLNSAPSANTKSAVDTTTEANKAQITKIYKGDETLTSSLSSLNKEQFRIDQLMKLYHDTQSGTAIAQVPELANRMVSMGVISDPSTIHSVADLQAAAANHVMQIIQQIKDTNSNLGAQPTRTFSSEVSGMIDNGENAKLQPEALFKLLTQAKALTNYQMDMTRGWTRMGGTGNRVGPSGYTMPPDTYAQKFMDTHDVGDYLKKTEQSTPAFKGMPASQGNSAGVKKWVRVDGKLVQQ